ncbi:2,3-diaminopropionate biosynthesis protein SbnA [Paenibacillus chungangensis]|uniref:N-(2-amino-2-carboxyethyl)-L-glutamate synthase n=1 Tax=Paenibacillus chungangensis TaxID=696535 RepID=A0ABW3HQL3_9BACL
MDRSWLEHIGNTPLVPLSKLFANRRGIQVYGKLELMNPTGSAKDRPALRILQHAWREGTVGPGSVVVESSSGNMAISMAAICSCMGMRFISVIDPRTTDQNIRIMRIYGAEVSYVAEPDPDTGEFLPARLQRVRELLEDIPGSFWPNQYGNSNNPLAHEEGTMREIAQQLGSVDYVAGGVSSCGTMLGCSQYIRKHGLPTKSIAVDAAGSIILGGSPGKRLYPGLGAGIVPPFAEGIAMDYAVKVTDRDMTIGCHRLLRQESILAGPSSGAVISVVQTLMDRLPEESVIAAIIHDRGERYLDTVYNEAWVEEQFGTRLSEK